MPPVRLIPFIFGKYMHCNFHLIESLDLVRRLNRFLFVRITPDGRQRYLTHFVDVVAFFRLSHLTDPRRANLTVPFSYPVPGYRKLNKIRQDGPEW